MKRLLLSLAAAAICVLAAGALLYPQGSRTTQSLNMPEAVAFRILLGVGDKEPTVWDGKVSVSEGKILRIEGWQFGRGDSTDGRTGWKASTQRVRLRRQRQARGPVRPNGVIITTSAKSPNAAIRIETAQGKFSFTLAEAPYGKSTTALNGRVRIDRLPATLQLTRSIEEQDLPAVAETPDAIYVAYVNFVHGDRSKVIRGEFEEVPKNFDFLARPVGGDQVRLLRYSKSKRIWTGPENVSAPKQDCMRTAVAVDGTGRVWVVWSANQGGNFDLYARSLSGEKWGPEIRVTSDPGNDLDPVAVTDSAGRVWIAWQAARNGNLEILTAVQEGDRFSAEQRVSFSSMSDWDAAIAAASNGEVAVSWDTYDKGDYDVYFRRMRYAGGIRMEKPVPVAATPNFEARSSIAYDAQNRLWVAYEGSDTKWGKDFGAYETTGIALYQGHDVHLKCFRGDDPYAPGGNLKKVLAVSHLTIRSRPQRAARQQPAARQRLAGEFHQPDPNLAKNRAPSSVPQRMVPPVPRNSFPRVIAGPDGVVYLAYRSSSEVRTAVGTAWFENIAYFDGRQWHGPVLVPHSDGLLDNRVGLATPAPGRLVMVAVSDHRWGATGSGRGNPAINSDLYAAEFQPAVEAQAATLKPLPPVKVAPPEPEVKSELDQVAFMRNYRVNLRGQQLRLLRGEFHRHTEISGDGGGDGPLVDAYRYLIDAAYMDWAGCCDHDNGGGREYSWWIEQKFTDAYRIPGRYTPMFSYERSVRYPEGHRNVLFAQRGVRPLPRYPKVPDDAPEAPAPDTQMLYAYLRQFHGIVASHTSGTNMGTDWRDNDPKLEPVVEIYQGDRQNYEMPGAPRSNSEKDSIGGWRPKGFVSRALMKGYRLGFQASSDHISTHMSYCNVWVREPAREAIMDGLRKRHVYGATDNILADVRCGEHFMGEEFSVSEPPEISVKLWGTANFAKVHIIKDNQYVYTAEPGARTVDFVWKDPAATRGKTSYYYVRGEQADGEIVWVSPMWITYR